MGGFVALCRGVTVLYVWMYCMHVWAEDETQSLMIKTCLSHTLQQHNTDKMKAAKKKKKKKKYLFFFYAGLHREDAQPIAAAPVTISPPFGRRNGEEEEKKSVPRMNRTKHFVFSSFFFWLCVPQ